MVTFIIIQLILLSTQIDNHLLWYICQRLKSIWWNLLLDKWILNFYLTFSKQLIEKSSNDFADKKVGFATTNYHIFRGYILAKENDFEAQGISSKTKLYFFPNAFLREFIGLLKEQIVNHSIIIALIICSFLTLSFL